MADTKKDGLVGGEGGLSRGAPPGLLAQPRLMATSAAIPIGSGGSTTSENSLNKPVIANPFAANSSSVFNSTKSVLRPSQLKAPFQSNNIFGQSSSGSSESSSDNPFAAISSTSELRDFTSDVNKSEVNSSTDSKKEDDGAIPKFVPLHTTGDSISFASGTVNRTPTGLARASGFVFGQNLQDRVAKQPNDEAGPGTSTGISDNHTANGTSDLLFSAAVQASADSQSATNKEDAGTLAQAAEAWERARDAPPPAHPPGPILTGEEGETNVFQINCRLFAFEGGAWRERGRGQLRLNDADASSRLLCRAAGSLRVLLNTKVWADMTVERASSKSLRVTATDSQQQLKVFLIMASPEEIIQLHKSLSRRVSQAKKADESNSARDCTAPDSTVDILIAKHNSENVESSNIVSSNQSELIPNQEEELCDLPDQDDMIVSQSGNPTVVVSAEDDDPATRGGLKRVLVPDSGMEPPKKLCATRESPQL